MVEGAFHSPAEELESLPGEIDGCTYEWVRFMHLWGPCPGLWFKLSGWLSLVNAFSSSPRGHRQLWCQRHVSIFILFYVHPMVFHVIWLVCIWVKCLNHYCWGYQCILSSFFWWESGCKSISNITRERVSNKFLTGENSCEEWYVGQLLIWKRWQRARGRNLVDDRTQQKEVPKSFKICFKAKDN